MTKKIRHIGINGGKIANTFYDRPYILPRIHEGPIMIRTPYLLFLGDAHDNLAAKVAQGIKDWNPDSAVGQFRMDGCNADVGAPDMSLQEAYDAGARTLVVGVATPMHDVAPLPVEQFAEHASIDGVFGDQTVEVM